MENRGERPPTLLFHGGTGSVRTPALDDFVRGLLEDLALRFREDDSALDLAVGTVTLLEGSGFFNAGRGAVSQADGVVRRDAGAMDGRTLEALGISQAEGFPEMARLVAALLGKSGHVHLDGGMVRRWARRTGWTPTEPSVEKGDPTSFWVEGIGEPSGGTVGCVVRDRSGNLAAVTSTGGIGRMWPGRIGDSPIVGGGFYADNELGAISMTGVGESILKSGGGLMVLTRLTGVRDGMPPVEVLGDFFRTMNRKFGGTGGCVGIDFMGRPFAAHSSIHMVHGWIGETGEPGFSDVGHFVGPG
jgi:beta-aspartyl-peptidase (threonine type)